MMTTLLGVPVSLLSSIASRHAFLSVYCILGVFQSREAIPESVDAPDRHASQAASQQNLDQSDLSRVRRDEDVVLTGEFELLSLTQASTSANGTSSQCSMSADGSVVVFQSNADNIVSLDENDMPDVFLLDRSENTIRCISLSADVTGQDSRTTANGASGSPSISADGRYVVFHSEATNLVEIDENGCSDVFLYDSKKTSVSSISQSHAGSGGDGDSWGPRISGSGEWIVFSSAAQNIVPLGKVGAGGVFIVERSTGRALALHSGDVDRQGRVACSISYDGHLVSWGGRPEASGSVGQGTFQQYLWDVNSGVISLITVSSRGIGDADSRWSALSSDGKRVAIESRASNLVSRPESWKDAILVYELETGKAYPLPAPDGVGIRSMYSPSFIGNTYDVVCVGEYRVEGEDPATRVLVSSNDDHRTRILTGGNEGRYPNKLSMTPQSPSLDVGVLLASFGDNLVSGDDNGVGDVFLWRPMK